MRVFYRFLEDAHKIYNSYKEALNKRILEKVGIRPATVMRETIRLRRMTNARHFGHVSVWITQQLLHPKSNMINMEAVVVMACYGYIMLYQQSSSSPLVEKNGWFTMNFPAVSPLLPRWWGWWRCSSSPHWERGSFCAPRRCAEIFVLVN